MALLQRLINVAFQLAAGPQGQINTFTNGTTSYRASGLRTSCTVVKYQMPVMDTLTLRIWGLSLSVMNQLSTLGSQYLLIPRNQITVEAGDIQNGMGTIFIGTIRTGWPDFSQPADVPFVVEAQGGLAEAVIPAKPTSFPNGVDVSTFMSTLAQNMRWKFENNGVTTQLPPSYFSGSWLDQAKAAQRAGGFQMAADSGTLAIWPQGQAREGQIPLITPPPIGGMIGYPTYSIYGPTVRTTFDRNLRNGGQFRIESSLEPANKTWLAYALAHQVDSMLPSGKWESVISGVQQGQPVPLSAPPQ